MYSFSISDDRFWIMNVFDCNRFDRFFKAFFRYYVVKVYITTVLQSMFAIIKKLLLNTDCKAQFLIFQRSINYIESFIWHRLGEIDDYSIEIHINMYDISYTSMHVCACACIYLDVYYYCSVECRNHPLQKANRS